MSLHGECPFAVSFEVDVVCGLKLVILDSDKADVVLFTSSDDLLDFVGDFYL